MLGLITTGRLATASNYNKACDRDDGHRLLTIITSNSTYAVFSGDCAAYSDRSRVLTAYCNT